MFHCNINGRDYLGKMEVRQWGWELCWKWKGRKGGAQRHLDRWCNMKWKIGHLIRKSEKEIRGAGCKEIVTNERQLCAPLCLHLDLVASTHESSFCDVTEYWPLEGPRTESGCLLEHARSSELFTASRSAQGPASVDCHWQLEMAAGQSVSLAPFLPQK